MSRRTWYQLAPRRSVRAAGKAATKPAKKDAAAERGLAKRRAEAEQAAAEAESVLDAAEARVDDLKSALQDLTDQETQARDDIERLTAELEQAKQTLEQARAGRKQVESDLKAAERGTGIADRRARPRPPSSRPWTTEHPRRQTAAAFCTVTLRMRRSRPAGTSTSALPQDGHSTIGSVDCSKSAAQTRQRAATGRLVDLQPAPSSGGAVGDQVEAEPDRVDDHPGQPADLQPHARRPGVADRARRRRRRCTG